MELEGSPNVRYIRSRIGRELQRYPGKAAQIAQGCLTLLDTPNKGDNYLFVAIMAINEVEKVLTSDREGEEEVFLPETKNAAVSFCRLNASEVEEVRAFLSEYLPQPEEGQTLEQFLLAELGGNARPLHSGRGVREGAVVYTAAMSALSGNQTERIHLYPNRRVSDEELTSLIVTYYRQHGYEVEVTPNGSFGDRIVASKGKQRLNPYFSNYGDQILVSINVLH